MIAPFVRIAHSVVYRINPVLPQAYDDSLSYFEVLARLQKKINELIDAVNALEDAVEELDTRLTTVENKIEEIIENVNSIDDRVKYLEEHPYILPIATATTLGGVKIGDGITAQADGTISVEGGSSPYVLPTMDETTKGGARLGEGLIITDSDKLDVDVDNLDLSNNSSIVNIENNIDEIENNIEALDTDITNIISGETPVPSSYELPTMDEDTKGGAKLGDGLVVESDVLAVDVDNLDLSNNETITNIIDGTTQIDISENETIQDIISGETPVPFVLPVASSNTLGGIKVGQNLSIENDGTLNASGGEIETKHLVLNFDLYFQKGTKGNDTPYKNFTLTLNRQGNFINASLQLNGSISKYNHVDNNMLYLWDTNVQPTVVEGTWEDFIDGLTFDENTSFTKLNDAEYVCDANRFPSKTPLDVREVAWLSFGNINNPTLLSVGVASQFYETSVIDPDYITISHNICGNLITQYYE